VAKKNPNKNTRLKTILLFVLVPLIIWALALLIWLYWNDIANSFSPGKDRAKPAGRALRKTDEAGTRSDEAQPKEKILDEDRKKLDEIIQKENR
jgi:hypothetical protein